MSLDYTGLSVKFFSCLAVDFLGAYVNPRKKKQRKQNSDFL